MKSATKQKPLLQALLREGPVTVFTAMAHNLWTQFGAESLPSCCTSALAPPHTLAFCKKHKVSLDWLLFGDLQGLHRMTKEAKATPPEIPEAHRKEIMRLFSALTPQKQVIGFALLRELMVRSIPNG
jgi:hypothetical protein